MAQEEQVSRKGLGAGDWGLGARITDLVAGDFPEPASAGDIMWPTAKAVGKREGYFASPDRGDRITIG
jgi:hypothetical protein